MDLVNSYLVNFKDSQIKAILLTSNPNRLDLDSLSKASIYKINLSDPIDVKRVFEEIYHDFGHLDVLINNAAVNSIPDYEDFEFK